jgi:heme/copper-type cytochrome/quinol oxidase subunit 2
MNAQNKTGATVTLLSYLVGILPESVTNKTLAMMPAVDAAAQNQITFWLQSIAFIISIVVGILTAISWFRKNKKEKRHV